MKISATVPNQPEVSIEYDIPASLDAKISKFGRESVNKAAGSGLAGAAYVKLRQLMTPKKGNAPESAEAIQAAMAVWLPDQQAKEAAAKRVARAEAMLADLSPEERKAALARYARALQPAQPAAASASKK